MNDGIHVIDAAMAPAIGDIRSAGPGDVVHIRRSATQRGDWPRYWEAAGIAFARGAVVSINNQEE